MTTIAVKDGIIAADSWVTYGYDGASRHHSCVKLYKKTVSEGRKTFEVIIATAGDLFAGLMFVDWYGTGKQVPEAFIKLDAERSFICLVLTPYGLYEVDELCRMNTVLEPFYAIGSGSAYALGAMACGKSARDAVRIAARFDSFTGGRITTMSLPEPKPVKRRKRRG